MEKIRNFNIVLVAVIILLLTVILSFNYGYNMGERRGYVMGVQKCLEGVDINSQTKNNL
jgi:hypothetical protein